MPAVMISALAVILALAGSARAQLGPEQYAADLTHLLEKWLPKNVVLDEEGRREARALLESNIASASKLNDRAFALAVMRTVSLSKNGHNLAGFGLLSRMPRLPVRLWWFSDGLYVVKADKVHTDLIGARVDAFGELSPVGALKAARPYLSGNESWQRHRSIEFLSRLPLLAGIGASASPEAIPMAFTLPGGRKIRRVLGAANVPDPEYDTLQPWRESLYRLAGADEDGSRWPHVLDTVKVRPKYLETGDNVSYEVLEDMQAVYVRLASIRNTDGTGSLQNSLFSVLSKLEQTPPKNLIIDLRYNTGGNFFNSIPFAFGVGVLVPPPGRIFFLANRCTFSAAIVTMAIIKHRAGHDRITIVGEPIGDRLRFWSEGGHVTLPNSRILATYNDGLHDMIDGCQPDENCWWGAAAFEHGVGELNPDIRIHERFEDYRSGRDLYLEAVKAELVAPPTTGR